MALGDFLLVVGIFTSHREVSWVWTKHDTVQSLNLFIRNVSRQVAWTAKVTMSLQLYLCWQFAYFYNWLILSSLFALKSIKPTWFTVSGWVHSDPDNTQFHYIKLLNSISLSSHWKWAGDAQFYLHFVSFLYHSQVMLPIRSVGSLKAINSLRKIVMEQLKLSQPAK